MALPPGLPASAPGAEVGERDASPRGHVGLFVYNGKSSREKPRAWQVWSRPPRSAVVGKRIT
jgi:hypothetical protein